MVYQAIRDSAVLPEDVGFYLVAWQVDAITSQVAEVSLRAMDERLAEITRECGIAEDESQFPSEAAEEYENLQRQYEEAWDGIFLEKLEASGEVAMARLFHADPKEFRRRNDAGRQYFHGIEDPEVWLDQLAEAVAECMTAQSASGPLQYRCREEEEEEFWEVVIYPAAVELVGGAADGEVLAPGFSLDLEGLQAEFERVDAFTWESLGFAYSEGPHVSIEGIYQGHEVYLQILAYAPEGEEPGMKLDAGERPSQPEENL